MTGSMYLRVSMIAHIPNLLFSNSNSAIRFRRMTYVLSPVAWCPQVYRSDNACRNSAALVEAERPFQLDICIWGNAHVWEWGARVVSTQSPHVITILCADVVHTPTGPLMAHVW